MAECFHQNVTQKIKNKFKNPLLFLKFRFLASFEMKKEQCIAPIKNPTERQFTNEVDISSLKCRLRSRFSGKRVNKIVMPIRYSLKLYSHDDLEILVLSAVCAFFRLLCLIR